MAELNNHCILENYTSDRVDFFNRFLFLWEQDRNNHCKDKYIPLNLILTPFYLSNQSMKCNG